MDIIKQNFVIFDKFFKKMFASWIKAKDANEDMMAVQDKVLKLDMISSALNKKNYAHVQELDISKTKLTLVPPNTLRMLILFLTFFWQVV